jgi:hypothetical protein
LTPGSLGSAIEKDPKRWVLAIVALHSLVTAASTEHATAMARLLFVASAVLAPLAGVIFFFVRTRLVYWAGRALGGQARWDQIRAVDAWSSVPWLVLALPMLPLAVLTSVGEATAGPVLLTRDLLQAIAPVLGFVLPFGIGYGALLFTLVLAEVQQFSVWRSVLNQMLAVVLGVALPGLGIALGYGFDRLVGWGVGS